MSTAAADSARRLDRLAMLVVCVVVVVLWWPAGAYWQSDDFIAVHYAADGSRAWSDFVHNQYDLEGVVWFYRPLVTLSFWFEQVLAGGPSPGFSHATNLALHVAATVLVARLGARLSSRRAGVLAAAAWATIPAHAGVVWWAVGRVDGLATVFMLAACLAFVRDLDRGARRGHWIALFALALASKESALALPAALVALALVSAAPGARLRSAARAWPSLVVLAVYFAVRRLALGRFFGGYDDATPWSFDSLTGLASGMLHVAAPMLDTRADATRWLGLLPLAVLVYVSLCGRARKGIAIPLLALSTAIACAVPALPLWSQISQPMNQRLLGFACVPLALWCGRAGLAPTLLFLLAWGQPQLELTSQQQKTWREVEAVHRALREEVEHSRVESLFVANLPHGDPSGRFVSLHLGVDRLLVPPFVEPPPTRTFALRPLAQRGDAIEIPFGMTDALPFSIPTLRFGTDHTLSHLRPSGLPDVRVEYEGPAKVPSTSFMAMQQGKLRARIRIDGVKASHLRVTAFTSGGYLSAVLPNEARDGEPGCALDLRSFLVAPYVEKVPAGSAHVLFALGVAVTFDLDTRYPFLIETGTATADAVGRIRFEPTAANHEPLWIAFDRAIPAFLAGRL